jgi:DNA-binding MarR family transcriptional regulator
VLNAFVDATMWGLPRATALTWLVLWRDTRDGIARTSMVDIADCVGCDERSAKRAVRQLVDKGLVEVVRRGGKWRGVSTYRVTPVSPCMGTKRCQNR